MYGLRSRSWKARLEQAFDILKQSSHPIARYTLQVIKSKAVEIFPFNKATPKDLKSMVEHSKNVKASLLKNGSEQFKKAIEVLNEEYFGYIVDGERIYLRVTAEPAVLAKTLVHEVNHHINGLNYDAKKKEEVFLEELRTHVAEKMFKATKPFTRSQVKKISNEVAGSYGTPVPLRPSLPEGIYYPIPKKLR